MVVRLACQFGVGIYLARLLGPEPYGIVAATLIITTLAGLLSEGGISSALIQARELDDRTIAGAFWAQVALGLAFGGAVALVAGPACHLLGVPNAIPVMQVTAIGFPIGAISANASALLRRRLQMQGIQIASAISYVVGYGGCGLAMAHAGCGVWALVGSSVTQGLINAVILQGFARSPWRQPRFSSALFRFSAWSVAVNLICWAHANAANALMARWMGAIPLGHYSRFALFTDTTVPVVVGPVQQVLLPAISRVNDQADAARQHAEAALHGVALLYIPAMTWLALEHRVVVEAVFGPAYVSASPMVIPMALSTLAMVLLAISGPILTGMGRPRDEAISQCVTLPISIMAPMLLLDHGPLGICWGLCMATWVRMIVLLGVLHHRRIVSGSGLVQAIGSGLILATVAAGSTWICQWAGAGASPLGMMLIMLTVILVLGGALLLCCPVLLPLPARELLLRVKNRAFPC